MNKEFLRNNIKRALIKDGRNFVFYRNNKDKFKQVDKSVETEVVTIKCIYHKGSVNVETLTATGDKVFMRKPSYKLTCLYEDLKDADQKDILNKDDFINYLGNRFEVVDIVCVDNFGVVAQIDLKVKDNGGIL